MNTLPLDNLAGKETLVMQMMKMIMTVIIPIHKMQQLYLQRNLCFTRPNFTGTPVGLAGWDGGCR